MSSAEQEALLQLATLPGPVAPRIRLLEQLGRCEAVLAAGSATWRAARFGEGQIAALTRPAPELEARREIARNWLHAGPKRELIGWHDPAYPDALRETASPPLALWLAGDVALLWRPQLAIVGSRNASAGGREAAQDFARTLAEAGFVITSGLASGIDAAAHAGAMAAREGRTVAVVATGPDIAYPAAHAGLQQRIAEGGAVVSEHPPGTAALREHFPSRNRIVAGLSLGTLVIEASLRSGALITARLAAEQGREVFALPGPVDHALARGCHQLLREGATLVETPEEIAQLLEDPARRVAGRLRAALGTPENHLEHGSVHAAGEETDPNPLWQALGPAPSTMDQVVSRSGLTVGQVSSMLLVMELRGQVAVEHGRYRRKRASGA